MAMKKKYKATAALAISAVGAAGTWGIAHTGFLAGMVHHGFLAAVIGGMADWFAVTALFRKPLGISYRTEIIIRNRQRIMEAIVDFAAKDLLAVDNVMAFVRQRKISDFLVGFLQRYGESKVLPYAGEIGTMLQSRLSSEAGAAFLAPAISRLVKRDVLKTAARDLLRALDEGDNPRQLLHILAAAGEELLKDTELKALLARHVDVMLREYGEAVTARSFLMNMLGLSGDMLMDKLWDKARLELDSLAKDEAAEAKAVAWLTEKLADLPKNEKAVDLIASLLGRHCSEAKLQGILRDFLDRCLADDLLVKQLQKQAAAFMAAFATREDWQEQADVMLKDWLETELRSHHDVFANMIEERLNRLSDEELVEFTEEKVADDLQMIRINGSVVGSLVGMGLYVVVHVAGQVLSR